LQYWPKHPGSQHRITTEDYKRCTVMRIKPACRQRFSTPFIHTDIQTLNSVTNPSIYILTPTLQDCICAHHYQQGRRPHIQPNIPRCRSEQAKHQRLPRPRRNFSRVSPPPHNHLVYHTAPIAHQETSIPKRPRHHHPPQSCQEPTPTRPDLSLNIQHGWRRRQCWCWHADTAGAAFRPGSVGV